LKFGGSSVAGRGQWETIARLAASRREEGFRVLLVCSAVAGVTSELSALADEPESVETFDSIRGRHERLAAELEIDASELIGEAERRLRGNLARLGSGDQYAPRADLLATGEWLSTRIGAEYLRREMPLSWVDVRDVLVTQDEPELSAMRRWLSGSCRPGPDPELARQWEALEPVVITQGYVARNAARQTVLLGRGGSDTSAALLAGRLQAEWLEIWSDVPGLFSADPRRVPWARLLERLDYAEALEMAASGAKVVDPRAIRAAEATRTPVVVRDTARPGLTGTRIAPDAGSRPGVKAVTCQQNMVVLLLQNLDSRREVGFLARVFGIIRQQGISVDLVATSETTTTVAINAAANHLDPQALGRLVRDLQSQCSVRVHQDCVCVNLVGHGARTALARLTLTLEFFQEHPLLMLSQSANDLCLSLLLEARDHERLLELAHEALVPAGGIAGAGHFGPSWRELTVS
jgi:diaminopimelate decarboxylase/aspartate kinase